MRRLPILLFVIVAAGWVGCSAAGEPGKRPGGGGQGGGSGFGGSAANGGNGASGQPDASSSDSGGSDGSTGSDGGPTCSDVCALGTSDCFGNAARTCAVQGTGCTDWNAPQACSTGTDVSVGHLHHRLHQPVHRGPTPVRWHSDPAMCCRLGRLHVVGWGRRLPERADLQRRRVHDHVCECLYRRRHSVRRQRSSELCSAGERLHRLESVPALSRESGLYG